MGITPVDNSEVMHRWGPPVGMLVLGWLGTVAATWWFVASCSGAQRDPGTLLFSGLSTLVLALCALYGSRARPRLSATSAGIEVRGLRGTRRYGWAQVADVRLLHTPGLGRKTLTLEITVHTDQADDELLLIFSRLDLGADPRDVLDDLTAARPTR
jgi:Bacterial PH domain